MSTTHYRCRDIGYGVERGEVELPALSEPDWTGKRQYRTVDGDSVYLFDDEVEPFDGDEHGPRTTIFADPDHYPPTPLSQRFRGTLCAFGDGEQAAWMILGRTGKGPMTTGTPVCDGHRDAVLAREATWI